MKKLFFYCIAILFWVNGCDSPVNQNNSNDYSIEQQLGCYCPLGGVWVKLYIKADTIAQAIAIADNRRLSYEEQKRYKTIKGLFNVMAELDTSIYNVKILMDSINNYPSLISFNPKPEVHGDTVLIIMDAQMAYTTKNYVKLN